MKHVKSEKGFTLVELAIVMTIIGLLIGGILKGQELMENARVTSTISQVKSYEAAVTTFQDTYNALPGDMANAATRLPNCVAACNSTDAGPGNGIVGTVNGVATAQAAVTNEPTLFWTHLLLANLISGVTPEVITTPATAPIAWGESHPGARINGGFHAKNGDGATALALSASGVQPAGLTLVLQTAATGVPTAVLGGQPLSALRAAQIDRKMDDGKSATGQVIGYGMATCSNGGVGSDTYNEGQPGEDCGLFFRLR